MNYENIQPAGHSYLKSCDARGNRLDHGNNNQQTRQKLTVDMRALQESACQSCNTSETRPITSRGRNVPTSGNGINVPNKEKLDKVHNKTNAKTQDSQQNDSEKGSSEGILIIHGAIHKISIHGEPYVPRAMNKGKKKLCSKNRAPTPYPHREIELLRQEMLERIGAQLNRNGGMTKGIKERKIGAWMNDENDDNDDPMDCENREKVDQPGNLPNVKFGNNEKDQKYYGYQEYERSKNFVRSGDSIGEQASNRLVCHTEKGASDTTQELASKPQSQFNVEQQQPVGSTQDYNNQFLPHRVRHADLFERRHGVSLDSFMLPHVGQHSERDPIDTSASETIASKEFEQPSVEVDTLLEELGWSHGDKQHTEGWMSPKDPDKVDDKQVTDNRQGQTQEIEMKSQEIGHQEKLQDSVGKDSEDKEMADKKEVAEFRVKMRQLWHKLFH